MLSSVKFGSLGERVKLELGTAVSFLRGYGSHDFVSFIHRLSECRTQTEESSVIFEELEKMELSVGTRMSQWDGWQAKECVMRLLFCWTRGHDVRFGYMLAVKAMLSTRLTQKYAAYLACRLWLRRPIRTTGSAPDLAPATGHLLKTANHQSELALLTVSSVQRDLEDRNRFLTVCMALDAVGPLVHHGALPAVVPVCRSLLARHPRDLVRVKAAMALCDTWQRTAGNANATAEFAVYAKDAGVALSDRSPSVMNASLCILTALLDTAAPSPGNKQTIASGREDPHELAGDRLVPALVSVLRQVVDQKLPPAYSHGGIPAPWIQIRLVRLLGRLCAGDEQLSALVYPAVNDVFRHALAAQQHVGGSAARARSTRPDTQSPGRQQSTSNNNLVHSSPSPSMIRARVAGVSASSRLAAAIVLECCRAVQMMYPNARLASLLAQHVVNTLLCDTSPNSLKCCGVSCLIALVQVDPDVLSHEGQLAVVQCLESADESLSSRTLSLLLQIATPANVSVIVDKMMDLLFHQRSRAGSNARPCRRRRRIGASADSLPIDSRRRVVRQIVGLLGMHAGPSNADWVMRCSWLLVGLDPIDTRPQWLLVPLALVVSRAASVLAHHGTEHGDQSEHRGNRTHKESLLWKDSLETACAAIEETLTGESAGRDTPGTLALAIRVCALLPPDGVGSVASTPLRHRVRQCLAKGAAAAVRLAAHPRTFGAVSSPAASFLAQQLVESLQCLASGPDVALAEFWLNDLVPMEPGERYDGAAAERRLALKPMAEFGMATAFLQDYISVWRSKSADQQMELSEARKSWMSTPGDLDKALEGVQQRLGIGARALARFQGMETQAVLGDSAHLSDQLLVLEHVQPRSKFSGQSLLHSVAQVDGGEKAADRLANPVNEEGNGRAGGVRSEPLSGLTGATGPSSVVASSRIADAIVASDTLPTPSTPAHSHTGLVPRATAAGAWSPAGYSSPAKDSSALSMTPLRPPSLSLDSSSLDGRNSSDGRTSSDGRNSSDGGPVDEQAEKLMKKLFASK